MGGHGSHGKGSHYSGSHGRHSSAGHSHRSAHRHIGRFVNSAVSGAGNAVGRDAVNAVVKPARPRASDAASTPANHAGAGAGPARGDAPATQSKAASGVQGAADLSHCAGFVQAMTAHGNDPAYAKTLKELAPECFSGPAPGR